MLETKLLEAERLANSFRNSLDLVSVGDRDVYNFLNPRNYLERDLTNYSVSADKVVESRYQNYSTKEAQGYFYYQFKLLNGFDEYLNEKATSFNVTLNKLKKDRIQIQDTFEAINIKLTNSYTQSYKRSIFNERGIADRLSLFDIKKNQFFLPSYQCEYKMLIESPTRQKEQIFPKKCYISKSTRSDTFTNKIENIDIDPNYIFRKGKTYKYIISKKQEKRKNIQVKDLEAYLELVFIFDKIEVINEITLDTGSSLPILLEKDDFQYYNEMNREWRPIEIIFAYDNFNNKKYFVNEVSSNKFKIKLTQRKSYSDISVTGENNINSMLRQNDLVESNRERQEIVKIFDLSVDNIEFYYKTYKQKGFYRESEYIEANELKEINVEIEEKVFENCFIEKEVEVIKFLNGEKVFQNFIPVSEGHIHKEALCFKGRRALLTFPPEDDLKVYINGVLLTKGRHYDLLVEGEAENINTNCYKHQIVLFQNIILAVENVFHCEYSVKFPINFNKEITINHSSISFKENVDAQYLISPRFIFRNLSKDNKSSLIKSYNINTISNERKSSISNKFKRLKATEIMESKNV
jgi:hypothetical protein